MEVSYAYLLEKITKSKLFLIFFCFLNENYIILYWPNPGSGWWFYWWVEVASSSIGEESDLEKRSCDGHELYLWQLLCCWALSLTFSIIVLWLPSLEIKNIFFLKLRAVNLNILNRLELPLPHFYLLFSTIFIVPLILEFALVVMQVLWILI